MTRWLPFPRVSAALLLTWLLLQQSLAPGAWLLGALLALALPQLLAALGHARAGTRRPRALLRLAGRVALDITHSNFAVARLLLRPRPRRAGFVRIPLALREPNGLAALACIISATPGTIWVDYDPASGVLLIHVLDLVEEATWIGTIRGRYETLLREIFE
jgi:multicomponent K+:H+ antiporter subunit E